jgi:hypothetical protein
MKKLIIITTLILFVSFVKAQPPTSGSNQANNFINKFVGDWIWTNGSDTLILKLRKYNIDFSDYTEDVLMGVHKYVKNGLVLDNSFNKLDSIVLNRKKRSVLLYSNTGSDTSKVEGSISDLTKKKNNLIFLQFVTTNPPTIIWKLELPEGVFSDPNFQYGLTMPKNLVLTKQ